MVQSPEPSLQGEQRRLKTFLVVKRGWQGRQTLSPKVAACLGEPMLECNMAAEQKEAMTFWDVNISDRYVGIILERSGSISNGYHSTWCGAK